MAKQNIWQIKKIGAENCWITFESPDGYWRAEIVRSGCIDINHSFNVPLQDDNCESVLQRLIDYIHICNIDDMIARLEALKAAAQDFFGEDWK